MQHTIVSLLNFDLYTAAKEPLQLEGSPSDARSRSSVEVEVEQILPSDKDFQDPRDFYAPDSPVLVGLDSDDEMYVSAKETEDSNDSEVRDDLPAGCSFVKHSVCFSR